MEPVFYIFGFGKDSVTSIKTDFWNNKLECQIENIAKSLARAGQHKAIRSITQSDFLTLPHKPAVIFLVTWAVTMIEIIWWCSLGGCRTFINKSLCCGSSGTAENPAPCTPQHSGMSEVWDGLLLLKWIMQLIIPSVSTAYKLCVLQHSSPVWFLSICAVR